MRSQGMLWQIAQLHIKLVLAVLNSTNSMGSTIASSLHTNAHKNDIQNINQSCFFWPGNGERCVFAIRCFLRAYPGYLTWRQQCLSLNIYIWPWKLAISVHLNLCILFTSFARTGVLTLLWWWDWDCWAWRFLTACQWKERRNTTLKWGICTCKHPNMEQAKPERIEHWRKPPPCVAQLLMLIMMLLSCRAREIKEGNCISKLFAA